MATEQFLKDNALKELERVEGTGYVIQAANGNSLFITDEVIAHMLAEMQSERSANGNNR